MPPTSSPTPSAGSSFRGVETLIATSRGVAGSAAEGADACDADAAAGILVGIPQASDLGDGYCSHDSPLSTFGEIDRGAR